MSSSFCFFARWYPWPCNKMCIAGTLGPLCIWMVHLCCSSSSMWNFSQYLCRAEIESLMLLSSVSALLVVFRMNMALIFDMSFWSLPLRMVCIPSMNLSVSSMGILSQSMTCLSSLPLTISHASTMGLVGCLGGGHSYGSCPC